MSELVLDHLFPTVDLDLAAAVERIGLSALVQPGDDRLCVRIHLGEFVLQERGMALVEAEICGLLDST